MGRPFKPTALHVVDGTRTRANRDEPRLPPGTPEPPAYLTAAELSSWHHFAKVASDLRVLTTADAAALEQLACAHAEAQAHRAYLRKHGRVYVTVTPQGCEMRRPRPEVLMQRQAERTVLLLLGRFGLTPADRAGVAASAAAPDPRDLDTEFT